MSVISVYSLLMGVLLGVLLYSPSIAIALLITVTSGCFIYLYSLP